MPVDFTTVAPDELEEYLGAITDGFGDPPLRAEVMVDEAEVQEPDRAIAARDDGRFVGGTSAFSFTMTMPGGGHVPAAGVTNVAVLPTHRRRGILRELMTRQFDEIAGRGEPVAILNASDSGIYNRFGYGPADRVVEYEIDNRHAAHRQTAVTGGSLHLVPRSEAAGELAEVYDRVARARPGALSRTPAWWKHILSERLHWRGGGAPFVVVHRDTTGTADGYAIYRIAGEWAEGHADARTVHIRELEGADWEVEAALWEFCCSIDLTRMVRAYPRPVDDPIRWRLAQPRRLRSRFSSDLLWVRPIDVAAFLSARSYATTDRLIVEIDDEFRPDAGGTFVVEGGPDGGVCARAGDAPDLRLAMDALGSISLGGVSVATLAAAGRVVELSEGAAHRADLFFGWHPGPYCSTTF